MYTMLIADDESLEREALRLFVETSDLPIQTIIESATGTETVKRVLLEKPDIIILDINMPGINGLEALEQFRVSAESSRVIISSAFDYFEYAKKAMQLGVMDFLVKPVRRDMFLDSLRRAIEELTAEREKEVLDDRLAGFIQFMGSRLVWDFIDGTCSDEVPYFLDSMNVAQHTPGFIVGLRSTGNATRDEKDAFSRKICDVSDRLDSVHFGGWRDEFYIAAFFGRPADNPERLAIQVISLIRELLPESFGSVDVVHSVCADGRSALSSGCLAVCQALSYDFSRCGEESIVSPNVADIQRICLFINENFTKKIGLDDIADSVGLTKFHVCRLFKQHRGETVVDYLTNVRLTKAKELLRNDDCSIKQLSSLVGYSDPNYFTWTFRKHEGMTPVQYRYSRT